MKPTERARALGAAMDIQSGRFMGGYAEIIAEALLASIPMLLWCPECGGRHIDEGDFATKKHHTHACQHCGHVWRPAVEPTCGVQFLPGFKNEESP
jgi:rubredoxin